MQLPRFFQRRIGRFHPRFNIAAAVFDPRSFAHQFGELGRKRIDSSFALEQ